MFILKLHNRHFMLIDAFILIMTPALALMLRVDSVIIVKDFWLGLAVFTLVALVIRLSVFWKLGLYSRYWKYASIEELVQIGTAVVVATFLLTLFILLARAIYPFIFARSILIIDSLLVLLAVGGVRFSVRFMESRQYALAEDSRRALIMGAGNAGETVARELLKTPEMQTIPIGFLDDDPNKLKMFIHGLPVMGSRKDIPRLAEKRQIDLLILAMPTAPGKVIREITGTCELLGLETKIVPAMYEILDGRSSFGELRDIDIEDLIRREPVQTDIMAVKRMVAGRRVLVTGGGGSIGRELCRQIMHCGPSELIILGHGENSIFETFHDLKELELKGPKLTPIIADVRFPERIKAIVQRVRPEIIFHTAAHKHVPLMELNPTEAITNNVLGTKNLLDAALSINVEHFVMISTDKAVKPTSIMGASKRTAELLVHQAAQKSGRPYVAVRFGNVLGSRGSVVLTFKRQIASGGPVTVTHPDVVRYFMTIPEAVQLVLQAAALGKGEEVFVLDMGEPIKIVDLARDLIKLSGYEVGRDIKIDFVGLRPGDKLFEELFIPGEEYQRTSHNKIFIAANASRLIPNDLDNAIDALIAAARRDDSQAIVVGLKNLVPAFIPRSEDLSTKPPYAVVSEQSLSINPAAASSNV
ncbi:MAG: nucleoside-diphosphate sugar epimerase/dehydratase [Candidatus Promineifilaceae bacterium]|nr:nucleoside-diphosphate sugar epimerase/dehydratase [Candidatus Promineifilaceae bacterium]